MSRLIRSRAPLEFSLNDLPEGNLLVRLQILGRNQRLRPPAKLMDPLGQDHREEKSVFHLVERLLENLIIRGLLNHTVSPSFDKNTLKTRVFLYTGFSPGGTLPVPARLNNNKGPQNRRSAADPHLPDVEHLQIRKQMVNQTLFLG